MNIYMKIAALVLTLGLTACGSQKKAVLGKTKAEKKEMIEKTKFLEKVSNVNSDIQFVSSKVKFTIETGPQELTLTGNLRMKRNDVIRLQLMAFGFVEAGRLEFTKDYVLVMDRINKQYMKAPYQYVDFLRNSGINFFTLQALFWNELFIPGNEEVARDQLENFSTNIGDEEVVISLDQNMGKLNYSWLANYNTGRIKMANIIYRDPLNGNSQLNWDYKETAPLGNSLFPSNMVATLTLPKKEIKLTTKLSYLGTDSDWETRTKVSDKYREVPIDEILMRFMAL